ncbi:ABC transporter substrate-binding protein [Nocardioides zeae]|uniref:ABC transporter substrate-binding protein n=1 Tax=Nocardioides imazamoxiresistens TaxID=3231893 RepID=A0ABU3Q0E7_9ACTN|nr:ABC transporter substrate-binding protein [Nocardioides zeae]MDT9594982.1 ABC transporter substrate-binding protein [Nocardioides zeae]
MTHRTPRRSPRPTAAGALALVAVAALTACSPGGSGSTDASDEARLRFAYAFTPTTALSPYSDDATTAYAAGATETLVRLDPAGLPEPSLATRWEQVDPTTWRFELRDDVVFHDGTPMTVETVVAALDAAAAAEPAPRALAGGTIDARADGDGAVLVATAEPDPVLVQRLTSPELVVLAPDAYADPARPTPVGTGTGPYEITDTDLSTSMTLEANPDYWAGTPALDGVDVTFVGDAGARLQSFRSGQVDLAQALPAAQLDQIDDDQLLAVPLPRTVSLHLTQTSPVLADPGQRELVRAAVAELDLAGTIYAGRAEPAGGLFNAAVSAWAQDRDEPAYPDAAAVAEAGPLRLATFTDRPELPEMATAIADALRATGFEVEVVARPYDEMEADYLDGAYDLVVMSRSYGQDTADPVGYLQADFSCGGTYNLSRSCDPDLDAELAAAQTLADPDERAAAAVAVEQQVLADVWAVPLVHDATQFGFEGVTDLAADPFERAVVTHTTSVQR